MKSLELAVSRRIGCCSSLEYLVKIGSCVVASRPSAGHVFHHLPANEKSKISLIKILRIKCVEYEVILLPMQYFAIFHIAAYTAEAWKQVNHDLLHDCSKRLVPIAVDHQP